MEFDNLKHRCEYKYCNQIEYLPIQCKYCKKFFCSKHIHVDHHECTAAVTDDVRVIKCQDCGKMIKYMSRDNPKAVLHHHRASGECTHSKKPEKVKRCAAPGCRKKLTSLNSFHCKKCDKHFCLKHRFPDDHDCASLVGVKEIKPKQAISVR